MVLIGKVAHPGPILGKGASPGIDAAVGAPCCLLPLSLVGQPLPRPFTIGFGPVPTDVSHWMVFVALPGPVLAVAFDDFAAPVVPGVAGHTDVQPSRSSFFLVAHLVEEATILSVGYLVLVHVKAAQVNRALRDLVFVEVSFAVQVAHILVAQSQSAVYFGLVGAHGERAGGDGNHVRQ